MSFNVFADAQTIWDYHQMHHDIQPADMIWALGSHDLRVADRAAELWHQGMAPIVVMSGGLGNFTRGHFKKPEAELFAERALDLGVPWDSILIENQSTNSGENVSLSRQLLDSKMISVKSAIAVHKPYMERRAYATIRAQWPELEVQASSPQLNLFEYCTEDICADTVINIMIGDLQRIMEYPKQGFMIQQPVPDHVQQAMDRLIEAGYTNHLLHTKSP
ncbi:Uncharacterized SAM-binding protein YcdF, DUF218 family [Rubritalea squalenifaciens DSM 18772]|uniref:Uncharacterized SAM-binding protein YcdF, DUF218 family n=2 Tax=Rubritalea TaxID=361050 RepID=A0A1M6B6D4_9BACT|nr:YdcF family protein [Rubritalea squalenifaciens]SHI44138.1 Uncharacterized SAM-binding protein YcdF, DUF218 family [Rubritalea squalenifaciens DSM 18772]